MLGLAKTFSDINYWSSCWKHNFTSLGILSEGIWGNTSACNQLQSKVTSASHKAFCIAHWKTCVLSSIQPVSHRLFLNAFNVKNYFINSVLPTCLPWLWYISEAQASLNVPACQSALGFSERTSLEDGWRGCEADESGKVSPAPLSFSLCMASLSTCFRFHHCTLTASLHMDSFKSNLSILIN